jgi:hypothetical protein
MGEGTTTSGAPEFVTVISTDSGAMVVHLTPGCLESSSWITTRARLKGIVSESPAGVLIDCRALPSGASDIVAPLLYDLLVLGRRQEPRIELGAVGRPDQSTGSGSAFLLPPRFESIEAAAASLAVRQTGAAPVKFARSPVSDEPIQWDRPRPAVWETPLGQMGLAVLVIGFTAGIVVYSAMASFAPPVMPRRSRDVDVDERLAVQGSIRSAQGKSQNHDPSAVVLAWPVGPSASKMKLTSTQVFDVANPPDLPPLVFAPAAADGRYSIHVRQLAKPSAPYYVLAISNQLRRTGPPPEMDLNKLAEFFEDSRQLLGDHQYVLEELYVDANVTKDKDLVFLASQTTADATPGILASPFESNPASAKHK